MTNFIYTCLDHFYAWRVKSNRDNSAYGGRLSIVFIFILSISVDYKLWAPNFTLKLSLLLRTTLIIMLFYVRLLKKGCLYDMHTVSFFLCYQGRWNVLHFVTVGHIWLINVTLRVDTQEQGFPLLARYDTLLRWTTAAPPIHSQRLSGIMSSPCRSKLNCDVQNRSDKLDKMWRP